MGERVERRLAAILAADVVGYSRHLGADEAGTLARLSALRERVLLPLLAEHGGRLFKTMGDGFLAEFPSAVQALGCALAIQSRQAERRAAGDGPLELRIGLHQGDVVVEGEDLLGDGVNIAARLEPLAEAGGISLSARVREDVTGKIDIAPEDLGEQSLKNIAIPARVFRIPPPRAGIISSTPTVPDRPSIAVLPFTNMSGDPEQEYLADGVVEDIITALSRYRWFFVIARNSSFTYKGRAVDVKQVGRELGVRYVLEGSVRKAGNRVRITGQLIEAATGHHIWADRFDGELADIFELQDRITGSIVGAVEPSLQRAEINRASMKPTENLDAYDFYLRALSQNVIGTRSANDDAITVLNQAILLDPNYVLARAFLSWVYMARSSSGWSSKADDAVGITLAREVTSVASSADAVSLAHAAHALSHLAHDYDQALAMIGRAISLNDNSAQILNRAGWVSLHCLNTDQAVDFFSRAARLSPLDPEMPFIYWGLGQAHVMAGRTEEGIPLLQRAVGEKPNWAGGYRVIILAMVRLGRLDEAKEAANRLLDIDPSFRLANLNIPYRSEAFAEELKSALRTAGIPD